MFVRWFTFMVALPLSAQSVESALRPELASLEALYTELHQKPELSYHETATAARLASELKSAGFEVTSGIGGTGVVGVLRNGAGPTLLIRTDMDGLPVIE